MTEFTEEPGQAYITTAMTILYKVQRYIDLGCVTVLFGQVIICPEKDLRFQKLSLL